MIAHWGGRCETAGRWVTIAVLFVRLRAPHDSARTRSPHPRPSQPPRPSANPHSGPHARPCPWRAPAPPPHCARKGRPGACASAAHLLTCPQARLAQRPFARAPAFAHARARCRPRARARLCSRPPQLPSPRFRPLMPELLEARRTCSSSPPPSPATARAMHAMPARDSERRRSPGFSLRPWCHESCACSRFGSTHDGEPLYTDSHPDTPRSPSGLFRLAGRAPAQ